MRPPTAARPTASWGCRQVPFTGGRAITPHRTAPNLRTSGRAVWLSEGRRGDAAAGPCACAWAVRPRGPSRGRQSCAEAGSAPEPEPCVPRAKPRPLSSAGRCPGRAEQDWDGLGWAGSPAGPTMIHRRSPGPLGAGGRRVLEGFAPGLRGQEAPKEQALPGGGGQPEASNPVHGEEERGSLLKRSFRPNNSKGEG